MGGAGCGLGSLERSWAPGEKLECGVWIGGGGRGPPFTYSPRLFVFLTSTR